MAIFFKINIVQLPINTCMFFQNKGIFVLKCGKSSVQQKNTSTKSLVKALKSDAPKISLGLFLVPLLVNLNKFYTLFHYFYFCNGHLFDRVYHLF